MAERLKCTLLERVHAMLKDSDWGHEFGAEAMSTACALMNCSHAGDSREIPHELFHGYEPDVSVLRVFGCTASVYRERIHRNKLWTIQA